MRDDIEGSEAVRRYASAHAVHYGDGDLREAIELYVAIIASHPDAREAGYSRAQIENIVKAVVPDRERLESGVRLALTRLGQGVAPAM